MSDTTDVDAPMDYEEDVDAALLDDPVAEETDRGGTSGSTLALAAASQRSETSRRGNLVSKAI